MDIAGVDGTPAEGFERDVGEEEEDLGKDKKTIREEGGEEGKDFVGTKPKRIYEPGETREGEEERESEKELALREMMI